MDREDSALRHIRGFVRLREIHSGSIGQKSGPTVSVPFRHGFVESCRRFCMLEIGVRIPSSFRDALEVQIVGIFKPVSRMFSNLSKTKSRKQKCSSQRHRDLSRTFPGHRPASYRALDPHSTDSHSLMLRGQDEEPNKH